MIWSDLLCNDKRQEELIVNQCIEEGKKMPTVIRGESVHLNKTWEPNILIEKGIESTTVENIDPPFTLTHVIIPPGVRTRPHYHANCARGQYIIKGRLRIFSGPTQEVFDVKAGDYIYTARGEIHSELNLSDTEPVEFVSTYSGVAARELSGKVVLDPPPK